MSDSISRQAVLDLIDGWTYDLCDKEDAWRAEEEIKNLPSINGLTDVDLIELEDRFGKNVRFVVEDMLKGEGKRWGT